MTNEDLDYLAEKYGAVTYEDISEHPDRVFEMHLLAAIITRLRSLEDYVYENSH